MLFDESIYYNKNKLCISDFEFKTNKKLKSFFEKNCKNRTTITDSSWNNNRNHTLIIFLIICYHI